MTHLPDLALNPETKLFPAGDPFSYNPFSGCGFMAQQDGPTRTLNAWFLRVQGWLNNSEVTCINLEEIRKPKIS